MDRVDDSRASANMSGQMSSIEIENALASIRRLVSDDFRPPARPQIVPQIVVEQKLILTPALRVVTSAVAAKPAPVLMATGDGQPTSVVNQPSGLADVSDLPSERPAQVNRPAVASLPRLHLGAELEIAPATPNVVATLSQAVDRQAGLDWDAETGDPEPDVSSLDWSSFTFARRSMRETWTARAAAVTTAAETVLGTPSGFSAAPMSSLPIGDEADFVSAVDSAPPEDHAWQADDPAVVTFEATEDWADAAEAEVIASLNQTTDDHQDPTLQSGPNLAPSVSAGTDQAIAAEVLPRVAQEEDNIFSEQVLRELVRDLIREQLQGDLGERITRNIRKLVKAEIARAMAVHALE